jgi:hypothetical protein
MRSKSLTIPELALLAGTRVAFGIGIGLTIAEKIPRDIRKGAACALLLVGALSTIPLAAALLSQSDDEDGGAPVSV